MAQSRAMVNQEGSTFSEKNPPQNSHIQLDPREVAKRDGTEESESRSRLPEGDPIAEQKELIKPTILPEGGPITADKELQDPLLDASNKEVKGGNTNCSTIGDDFYESELARTSASNAKWEEMFNRLLQYKEKHGHCLVPNRHPEDPQLGSWVSTQRRHYKILTSGSGESTPMTSERANRLMELGFQWITKDPRHVPWEQRYEELVEFKEKYGHSQVPIGWEDNIQLSNWVSTQRQEYKLMQKGRQSRLTPDRLDKLNKIEFVWEAQRGGPRRKRKASAVVPSRANPVESYRTGCPKDLRLASRGGSIMGSHSSWLYPMGVPQNHTMQSNSFMQFPSAQSNLPTSDHSDKKIDETILPENTIPPMCSASWQMMPNGAFQQPFSPTGMVAAVNPAFFQWQMAAAAGFQFGMMMSGMPNAFGAQAPMPMSFSSPGGNPWDQQGLSQQVEGSNATHGIQQPPPQNNSISTASIQQHDINNTNTKLQQNSREQGSLAALPTVDKRNTDLTAQVEATIPNNVKPAANGITINTAEHHFGSVDCMKILEKTEVEPVEVAEAPLQTVATIDTTGVPSCHATNSALNEQVKEGIGVENGGNCFTSGNTANSEEGLGTSLRKESEEKKIEVLYENVPNSLMSNTTEELQRNDGRQAFSGQCYQTQSWI